MDAHDNKKALSELQLANEPLKIEPYELNIPMLKSMMTHDALNNLHTISKDWMPDMRVPAQFYLNESLYHLFMEGLEKSLALENLRKEQQSRAQESASATGNEEHRGAGGFIDALTQLAQVACLPGIVGASIGLPDIHSGYGFAIGNVAAFDVNDPQAIVSPGGVGFDINCGVRLVRTNLTLEQVRPLQDQLTNKLFENIPVGIGGYGKIKMNLKDVNNILVQGIDWAIEKELAWPEDKEFCEENGRMPDADPACVSDRAKQRGVKHLGTLGTGNHYAEIQAVEEIYNVEAATAMGITQIGQICIMIHCGSRGLGHQVATDYVSLMMKVMAREHIAVKDLQLACAPIQSQEGQEYLKAMAAAANFAYCNRSALTHLTRKTFAEIFNKTPKELDMHLVYDVSHNMAKYEDHYIEGVGMKKLLVHRKGSTRAFPPHHPSIPRSYQEIGQPVLVGGSMGTCSYVLVGTEKGMQKTFGSTCHGAGRALSRTQSKQDIPYQKVIQDMKAMGISLCVASPEHISEEAPGSYKDVSDVVESCELAGISRKVFKLIPIGVIKG